MELVKFHRVNVSGFKGIKNKDEFTHQYQKSLEKCHGQVAESIQQLACIQFIQGKQKQALEGVREYFCCFFLVDYLEHDLAAKLSKVKKEKDKDKVFKGWGKTDVVNLVALRDYGRRRLRGELLKNSLCEINADNVIKYYCESSNNSSQRQAYIGLFEAQLQASYYLETGVVTCQIKADPADGLLKYRHLFFSESGEIGIKEKAYREEPPSNTSTMPEEMTRQQDQGPSLSRHQGKG